jgi:hypothetical protein
VPVGRQVAGSSGRDLDALGRTRDGRYLRVIYVPDPESESVFVVTAYELRPKAKHALLLPSADDGIKYAGDAKPRG